MSDISDSIHATPPERPDAVTQKAQENQEAAMLESLRFELHRKAEEQRIAHEKDNHPFYRWGKFVVGVVALLYIVFLSIGLCVYAVAHDFSHSGPVSVTLIAGAYLSNFGLLAIMLRGMFQGERQDSDPPITIAEVAKTIVDAVKSLKGSD